MLLAIDTSTPLVSVALYREGEGVLVRRVSGVPMRHGEMVAPLVEEALRAAGVARTDVTAVAVGTGPGPYTGLRVGLVSARVLGYALGVPVRGVCTLDVLATQVVDAGCAQPFVVVTDARRKEVFHAAYDGTGVRVDGPHVSRPAALVAQLDGRSMVGPGVEAYADQLGELRGVEAGQAAAALTVDAGTLADVAARGRAEVTGPEPIYLRRPDAVVPGPPKRVT